jgi:hypothetical protein
MVDVATLCELKGVNRFWRALSRRVLCSRLCRGRGQPAPTHLEEITDLDVELLIEAGRPGDTALAGRMLPGLARLHGYGFVVDVANVRAATLDEEDDEDDDENNDEGQEGFLLRGTAKAALESCISGDGEAPLKLKIAAVACAGTGVVCGVPVQHMREDTMPPPQAPDDAGNGTGGGRGKGTPRAMTELDLRHKEIQGPAAMLISYLIPAMGALTRIDVRGNYIAGDGAAQLAAAVLGNLKIEMFNEIPIKEMRANSLTELDLNGKGVGVEGGMVVVGLIPVMGAMTSIDLSNNKLCNVHAAKLRHCGREVHGTYTAEGIIAIADALRVNGGLTSLDLSYNMLCGVTTFGHGTYTAEGITSIAEALRVNGGLTKLSLAKNKLGEEGTKFLCDALVGNNTLKELDLSGDSSFRGTGSNIGGTAGAKHVANMLLVNGALTSVDLRGNQLGDEGWDAIFAAICGNKDSKIMSMDVSHENIGPAGVQLIAEALRTSITGAALTEVRGTLASVFWTLCDSLCSPHSGEPRRLCAAHQEAQGHRVSRVARSLKQAPRCCLRHRDRLADWRQQRADGPGFLLQRPQG